MSSLYTDYKCIRCLLKKYSDTDGANLSDRDKTLYLKELLSIFAEAPIEMSAPEIVEEITALQKKYKIDAFDYTETKKKFNKLLLSLEGEIEGKIRSAKDSLLEAVRYALVGNYIDFGALSDVDESKLRELIANAGKIDFDTQEYENMRRELGSCKNLVYLTDNCGEIVFDKLLIKEIQKTYPNIKIDAIVRGRDTLNDATDEDARDVGLDRLVCVTANGTGIAGTALKKISEEALALIEGADVIISKGMGNFETLKHSGKNIYYVFMCKCDKFCQTFGKPKFSYMLVSERRMKID